MEQNGTGSSPFYLRTLVDYWHFRHIYDKREDEMSYTYSTNRGDSKSLLMIHAQNDVTIRRTHMQRLQKTLNKEFLKTKSANEVELKAFTRDVIEKRETKQFPHATCPNETIGWTDSRCLNCCKDVKLSSLALVQVWKRVDSRFGHGSIL